MKRKEYRLYNLALILLAVVFMVLTLKLSSNVGLGSLLSGIGANIFNDKSSGQTSTMACSDKAQLDIKTPAEPHLAKLQQYQGLCRSLAVSRLMIFTSFPHDAVSAEELASKDAAVLQAFHESGVEPIVIVEPYIASGPMSYRAYLNGDHDAAVDAYFGGLRSKGIDDQKMGMWVPFPESNTPSWDNKDTEPKDFAYAVNRYLRAMKTQFPNTKGSILLNATTYEPTDLEYDNGDYISLIPYLQDIDRSLVSSVGIQGFPWVSRASQPRREIFRASEFLQPDYAVEAAKELRTRDIWFNTGSFASKYTNDSQQRVELTNSDRKAVLTGILEELKKIQTLQQNEYRVMVNIFAQDKSATQEATDWSYLGDSAAEMILREFLTEATKAGIDIALYDK